MKTKMPLTVKISCFILTGAISLLAAEMSGIFSDETGFTGSLLKFIDSNARREEDRKITYTVDRTHNGSNPQFSYQKGDWNKYVITPKYSFAEGSEEGSISLQSSDEINMNTYGSYNFDMLYGNSSFTRDKYRRSDDDVPVSRVIQDGLTFERRLQLHMEGNVGKRMTVYIDHDSEKEDNHYLMKYKAVNDDEVIREINAGEIDIKFEESKYAVYDDASSKGLGLDISLKKNKFKLKAFGSIIKGETEIETFRGNSSPGNNKLADYQYVKNTYYQLEPYKRYDGLQDLPVAGDDPYKTLITFTSNPASPQYYAPENVNISPSGFALYLDDQNPYNNLNSVQLQTDGGYYDLLVSGSDYTINFSTGLITLLKSIPRNSRLFAVYSLGAGVNTSDPAAITGMQQFSGKIFVFLKYGYSINEDLNNNFDLDTGEDINNDNKLNLDIYEIRSYYSIGEKQLLGDNFKITFNKENSIMLADDISDLGKYSIDYTNGLVIFNLREPFRQLYVQAGDSSIADAIYSENPSSNLYNNSIYNIRIDYYRDARSFQLKHFNIIPDSIKIKINSRELESSLYTVDYTSGYLQFTDPNNPVIGPDTVIEIRYEYLPYGGRSSSLATGVRADYQLNRNLNIGGSMLFTREGASDVIPDIGSEPQQTLLLETDASLNLSEKSLSRLVRTVSGINTDVPVEINAYAEYAHSYRKTNIFGKALIENMESNESVTSLSLSEKDWVLSSMPDGIANDNRGLLLYHYYRDPDNPETLYGTGYTPISIPYPQKPGPFNIATGHIPDSITDTDNQKSLGFNFDFSAGDYVPVVTRELSAEAIDFSGLEYIEVWYRSAGGTGEVELFFDIGSLNEDSDGDNILDTEDRNNNGLLDFDPSSSKSEDVGYEFNPSGSDPTKIGSGPRLNSFTTGDGVLNTEDLNRNGTLDTNENSIRFPGDLTTPFNSSNNVVIDMSDTTWKMARIYLDKSSSDYQSNSYKYNELLKKVESVRLYLHNRGSATTGTVYIDSIKFVSAIWGNIKLDDESINSPDEFSLTLVDSINDPDYRANSFILTEQDNYTSLYGDKSTEELNSEKETAMQIDYNLSTRQKGSATKVFAKPIDIRHYKTMNVWLNFRSFTPGDEIVMQIGSSETDYVEYRFQMDYQNVWREMRLKLTDSSGGNVEKDNTKGNPDYKRISFIRIEIYGQSFGRIWLDDIYLSEAGTLKDSAYWYEGEIKFKRPVMITDSGTPVFSGMNMKYINKGHGSEFSTIGKPVSDISEEYHEIFSSVNILPNWYTTLDYIIENSETDSLNTEVQEEKRGITKKRTLSFETDYASNINALPSVRLLYKQDSLDNTREEDAYTAEENVSAKVIKKTENNTYVPSVIVTERLNEFLWGSMVCTVKLDLLFMDEDIKRNADDNYPENIILSEKEKRQKTYANLALDYQNLFFNVQPSADIGSHEIVEAEGKTELNDTEVINDVNGDFHFPLIYDKEFKFVERDKKGNLKFGLNQRLFFSPNAGMEFNYSENNFRDYTGEEETVSGNFTRSKNADSSISNMLNFPFNFNNYTHLNFIKNIGISYSRSIYFQETDVPYEGEGTGSFDEQYGIKRVYNKFSEPAFNLLKFPPWHYLTGRGNFARGRDFAYNTFNEKITDNDNSPLKIYSNNLRLIENSGINSMLDFETFTLYLDAGINQVTERQSLYGIPQEVVSVTAGCDFNIDLMQIFRFGFFRPNITGIPYHSANMSIGYEFARDMLITSNIEENLHSPSAGFTFKRDRKSLSFKGAFNYRKRKKREYIPTDDAERNRMDDIYISNLQTTGFFKEIDKGYEFSILFETDVIWIHRLFSYLYMLTAYPIYSIEYSIILNRYDYSTSASPEPYDQHLITSKLSLDLHKNVQGGITARWALERFRSRETNSINREIRSYEIGLNFTLLF